MSQNQLKICIIEDMKPIRKLLTTILEKAGFSTVDFPDGTTSIDWLRDNKPDAVVMDIMLPDMSGTDILHYIRSLTDGSNIPVIAVTGFAQAGDRDKYINSGFDHYIAKPINTATFPDDIRKLISNKD